MNDPLSYKPSAYYYRQALRTAETQEEAVEIGLFVIAELEQLKEWVRGHGLVPPKWRLMRSELDEKQWGDVVPFPSSAEYKRILKELQQRDEPPTRAG